jgi:hypothetical protein
MHQAGCRRTAVSVRDAAAHLWCGSVGRAVSACLYGETAAWAETPDPRESAGPDRVLKERDRVRGDHLRVYRGGYHHHGIDLGDGSVVHFSGEPLNKARAAIMRASRDGFAAGGRVEEVSYHGEMLHPDHTCMIALAQCGKAGYRLVRSNCEHLARYCKTGVPRSVQVEEMFGTFGRRFAYALMGGPEAVVAVPVGTALVLGGKFLAHRVRQIWERPGLTPENRLGRVTSLYREMTWWIGASGAGYAEGVTPGWWFVAPPNGGVERIDAPHERLTWVCRHWFTADGVRVLENTDGWFRVSENGSSERLRQTWTSSATDPRVAGAPLAALNALLEAPRDLDELGLALRELVTRSPKVGDCVTYDALTQIVGSATSVLTPDLRPFGEDCRRIALWGLAALDATRSADWPSESLPSVPVIQWALLGEGALGDMPRNAVHALDLLGRPADPFVRSLLDLAADSPDPDVAVRAHAVLAGDHPTWP